MGDESNGHKRGGAERPAIGQGTGTKVRPFLQNGQHGQNGVAGDGTSRLPGGRQAVSSGDQYAQLVSGMMPPVKRGSLLVRAFLVGGTLCLIGQFVLDFFTGIEPNEGQAIATTLATMILLGALLTAFGVYDFLGEWGGFGAAVPITGFANSVVSSAMDFRREGLVLGMGSKMFVIAGPVIVFGILAGMASGVLAWVLKAVTP